MTINIIAALSSEARPIIDKLRLDRVTDARGFKLFAKGDVSLVVSGMGLTRAAAATGWLAARQGEPRDSAWLNVGIAGHGSRPVGDLVMASKIRDASTDRHAYPPPLVGRKLERDTVVTVDKPEYGYPEAVAYEMEAFAIWEAATRFVSAELVAFAKIVSDGPAAGDINAIDRDGIISLIDAHVETIETVIEDLRELSAIEATRTAEPAGFTEYTERWHFTVSNRNELSGLLRSLDARQSGAPAIDADTEVAKSARGALDALASRIDAMPVGI